MTTTIRPKLIAAALAATTIISTTAAVAGGVAAHRADDRATHLAAELDRERDADFEGWQRLLQSGDALLRGVWTDPDTRRAAWAGSARGAVADTVPVPDGHGQVFHACPAGEAVSPADVLALARIGVESGEGGDDREGFYLPSIVDVSGVRCVPAE